MLSASSAFIRITLLCSIATNFLRLSSCLRLSSGGSALGAGAICSRVPGLTDRQREMCRDAPDAMVAVGDGIRLGTQECQYQFRGHRWNCTAIGGQSAFGHVVVVGSREAAFTYAISSAGVAYAVTAACSRGNISTCGCDPRHKERKELALQGPGPSGWKWGGCSVDMGFGMRFARKFLDAREIERDARSLMNLHNNKAGRKAVKMSLQTECKCHGVSGSCTMKTCWKTLPPFRLIGDHLMHRYWRARGVSAVPVPSASKTSTREVRPLQLTLRRARSVQKTPKRSELVFLQSSPNYCERNLSMGSLGTVGRFCNRTSMGDASKSDGCDLLCCGRGYNTHQITRSWQCSCKFHWCCQVFCEICTEKIELYTCK
ncbi:protein Wnt-2 [Bemisia tabaci]|uniref:protein Wnt-2 n=1 Tax=Bemisia tabaci TaxID=7038 RepID=UPI001948D899